MATPSDHDPVLDRLIRWAADHPLVRALVLESSRARDDVPLDAFSDYDVLLVLTDPNLLAEDDAWLAALGMPVVRFRDTSEIEGFTTCSRLILYDDDTKIDFVLWPAALMRQVVERGIVPDLLDWGYRVLLDKDGLTAGLPAPTHTAHIPPRPTPAEYAALVEEFWWETTYVAKNLWRDELVHARYNLDVVLKHDLLLRMLEWRVEIDRNWCWKPGPVGRGLKRALPADLWTALEATFAGPGIDESWTALFATTNLFRRIANDVAAALGYTYLHDMDRRVIAYLRRVHSLPR